MHKRNHFTVACIIFSNLTLFYCTMENGGYDVVESSDYADLVSLFNEFREFQQPTFINGVPDYTADAMEAQKRGLKEFQRRLADIDKNSWPVSKQVDYILVWSEMNGLDFYHRVYKPWSRDPVFYLPSQRGAGPAISINLQIPSSLPLPDNKIDALKKQLKAIPAIYEQAKKNLTKAAGDLAIIAIHYIDREAGRYENLANSLTEHYPDLVPDAERAADAVRNYGKWLEDNISRMSVPAGIGIENYNWWLKNVHLFPYTWEECRTIMEHKYNRVVTFLKLEENRNRNLPELEVADTDEEYYRRLDIALNFVLDFLREEEILTVPDWLQAADYSDPNEVRGPRPSPPTIDTRARELEVLPGEAHEFIGHLFDRRRLERDDRPIRSAPRLYNMDWIRSEGWACSLEELFMVAGVLDNRPRRGREVQHLMNASHMALALPDLKMHSNEITFTEARRLNAELMPNNWTHEDDRNVWYEQQSNLRIPGWHTAGSVVGTAQFMKLFRERAMQLGNEFNIREFMDEFFASGMIPMSLTRWEMTGNDDEIKELYSVIK